MVIRITDRVLRQERDAALALLKVDRPTHTPLDLLLGRRRSCALQNRWHTNTGTCGDRRPSLCRGGKHSPTPLRGDYPRQQSVLFAEPYTRAQWRLATLT